MQRKYHLWLNREEVKMHSGTGDQVRDSKEGEEGL